MCLVIKAALVDRIAKLPWRIVNISSYTNNKQDLFVHTANSGGFLQFI